MEYIGKYEVAQQFGGREEGGWWYDSGVPEWKYGIPFPSWILKTKGWPLVGWLEDLPYKLARYLNEKERERAKKEEDYEYTSVLSYKSRHFSYGFSDFFKLRSYPAERPHYE